MKRTINLFVSEDITEAAKAAHKAARAMSNDGADWKDVEAMYWHATKLFEMAREYDVEETA